MATAAAQSDSSPDPSRPRSELLRAATSLPGDRTESVAVARSLLRSYGQRAAADFLASDEPVACAARLVRERAQFHDRLLRTMYRQHLGDAAANCALVAVGGYGRGRLHPGSDVDIMLLLDQREPPPERLEGFLQALWDIGLQPGHSVRGVEDCQDTARADVTIATALMESRPLSGRRALFAAMRERTAAPAVWPSDRFFEAKLAEQDERHARQGGTACAVEPNLKEAVGGLRDIHTIGWVAKRHFGADTFGQLVAHGFLTREELATLENAETLIEALRFALHTRAGRREDRLLFDYQRQVAADFGFSGNEGNLAVEQMMQGYYRAARSIASLDEMLLQHFEEALLGDPEKRTCVPINARFHSVDGYVEANDPDLFSRYPFALLEVALVIQQDERLRGIRASTARLVRANAHRIDDRFRKDIRARSLFMEILRQPSGITHALRRLSRYGVLGRYLPAFGAVAGKMQYDLFHIYTVDEHTLFVLGNLRGFEVGGPKSLAGEIFERLPKRELLFIAGLFHDIAKGRAGDHSTLGAEDAGQFCTEHGLSNYDTRLVSWLVQHHLLMSTTAQRRDITDPEVVADFAATVGDATHLNHLYLLTIADIRGTNPKLWNDWRAMLLKDLYLSSLRALRRGLGDPIDRIELVTATETQARELLAQAGIGATEVEQALEALGEDYLLRFNADEVSWHVAAIAPKGGFLDEANTNDGVHEPMVLVREGRAGAEVFTYADDQRGLFAASAATLSSLGLNIADARIHTADNGMALNTFVVFELDGSPVNLDIRRDEIVSRMFDALRNPATIADAAPRRTPRELRHFDTATRVRFYDDPGGDRTIIELVAADRPGLLGRLGLTLEQLDLRVGRARIGTLGERAEDSFYVTTADGGALAEDDHDEVRDALVDAAAVA